MARLPQGVRKRKDGTLEKRFTIDGQRISIYAGTVKELAEKERETRNKIEQGLYKANNKITLNSYFIKWVDRKKMINKSYSIMTYTSIYNNHIMERLGGCKIRDIERRQVVEMQKELAESCTAPTVNYIIAVLKIILNDAIRDEIINKNPAANIKNLKVEKKAAENEHRALTEKEQAIFMQESKTSYYYELFALALCTGMRCGELCALTWGDIDYNNNVIHVTKTQTIGEEWRVTTGDPKTAAGRRNIPLSNNAKQILKSQREKMGNIYAFDQNAAPVFVSIYGKTIYNTAINYELTRIIKEINKKGHNMERFTFHAFRDTFATRFIEQGGNMQTLKKILGHSSIKMTMDLYAHVLPDTMQDEMQKVVINI